MSAYASTFGAIGSMMKKDSKAQQAFFAIEKAIHIAKTAMLAVEMADKIISLSVDTAVTQGKIQNSINESTTDTGKGIIKAISSMPFPLNIAAGAATAAILYGILSSMGGSSGGTTRTAASKTQRVASSATLETPTELADSL